MKRTIKLTIEIDNINDDTPTGEDIATQLQEDFATIAESETVKVTLETEYDE